jgi:hypothetical protein
MDPGLGRPVFSVLAVLSGTWPLGAYHALTTVGLGAAFESYVKKKELLNEHLRSARSWSM